MMTGTDDYMLLPSMNLFDGKDPLLFLQDPPLPSPASESNFPSPISSTDSMDTPNVSFFDTSSILNLPTSVLESLSMLYQQQQQQQQQQQAAAVEDFDQFVKFEEDTTANPCAETATGLESPSAKTIGAMPVATSPASATAAVTAAVSAKPKTSRPPRQLECYNCHVTKTPLWRRTPDRAHSLCNACGLYYKQYGTHRPLHIRQKQHATTTACKQQQQIKQQPQQSSGSLTPPPPSSSSSSPPSLGTPPPVAMAEVAAHLLRPLLSQPASIHPNQSVGQPQQQQCSECAQTQSNMWRKNERGEPLCNTCGLYPRIPQQLKAHTVKRRRSDCALEDRDASVEDERPKKIPATATATTPANTTATKELNEIDDSRFKSLLSRMNTEQMHGFLGMLERRCEILRSLLYSDGH